MTTSPTSTATSPPPLTVPSPPKLLSESSIGGIAVGVSIAFALLLFLGWYSWRERRKATRKSRENAQLADALQRDGVQARIDELIYGAGGAAGGVGVGGSGESLGTTAIARTSSGGGKGLYGHWKPGASTIAAEEVEGKVRYMHEVHEMRDMGGAADPGVLCEADVHPAYRSRGAEIGVGGVDGLERRPMFDARGNKVAYQVGFARKG